MGASSRALGLEHASAWHDETGTEDGQPASAQSFTRYLDDARADDAQWELHEPAYGRAHAMTDGHGPPDAHGVLRRNESGRLAHGDVARALAGALDVVRSTSGRQHGGWHGGGGDDAADSREPGNEIGPTQGSRLLGTFGPLQPGASGWSMTVSVESGPWQGLLIRCESDETGLHIGLDTEDAQARQELASHLVALERQLARDLGIRVSVSVGRQPC